MILRVSYWYDKPTIETDPNRTDHLVLIAYVGREHRPDRRVVFPNKLPHDASIEVFQQRGRIR